jgi:hypothetical protein
MPINTKLKMLIRTRINNPHPILLPPLKPEFRILPRPIEFIFPIDEAVIAWDRWGLSFREPDFENWSMVPILEDHGAEIDVPVGTTWAVDDYWAQETFAVL